MPVTAERITAEAANGAARPIEVMTNVNHKALSIAAQFNARAVANMLRLQQHMFEFFTHRIERDIAAAEAFAKAGDGPEFTALAKEYCTTAISDFSEQSAEMMRRATAVTQETLAAAKADRAT